MHNGKYINSDTPLYCNIAPVKRHTNDMISPKIPTIKTKTDFFFVYGFISLFFIYITILIIQNNLQ